MIKDLVKQSRSYRGYNENRKISKEELLDFIDTARFCPSAVNGQPFRYLLAYEKEDVDAIQTLTKWAGALPQMTLPHEGKHPTAFIVILHDTTLSDNVNRHLKDCGIVAQTILLAATEKGLGGIMIGSFNGGELKRLFNLGEQYVPLLVIALGEPDEEIRIVEMMEGDSVKYYRDENDVHYVPKRKLEDIVLNNKLK